MSKLSDKDMTTVIQWLITKKADRCLVCKADNLTVATKLMCVVGYDQKEMSHDGTDTVPLISASCASCGHVMFYSAIIVGVLPDAN